MDAVSQENDTHNSGNDGKKPNKPSFWWGESDQQTFRKPQNRPNHDMGQYER